MANGLSHTAMGRDLLAQDYILKQLSASMMNPEGEVGKTFWQKVFQRALKEQGTIHVSMKALSRIWIVPENASIYEHGNSVFVADSKLKVMLEEDYLTWQKDKTTPVEYRDGIATDVLREVLIPTIEEEVNTGKHFANLRQIYDALILATWYKKNLQESLLGKIYVDQNNIRGIEDPEAYEDKQKIYEQYVQAFKDGAYNFIKEDYNPESQDIQHTNYFSGGADFAMTDERTKNDSTAALALAPKIFDASVVTVVLTSSGVMYSGTTDSAQTANLSVQFKKEMVARKGDEEWNSKIASMEQVIWLDEEGAILFFTSQDQLNEGDLLPVEIKNNKIDIEVGWGGLFEEEAYSQHPTTSPCHWCTGVIIRARKNGKVFRGIGHIAWNGKQNKNELQKQLEFIHSQLIAAEFKNEDILYFVDYHDESYYLKSKESHLIKENTPSDEIESFVLSSNLMKGAKVLFERRMSIKKKKSRWIDGHAFEIDDRGVQIFLKKEGKTISFLTRRGWKEIGKKAKVIGDDNSVIPPSSAMTTRHEEAPDPSDALGASAAMVNVGKFKRQMEVRGQASLPELWTDGQKAKIHYSQPWGVRIYKGKINGYLRAIRLYPRRSKKRHIYAEGFEVVGSAGLGPRLIDSGFLEQDVDYDYYLMLEWMEGKRLDKFGRLESDKLKMVVRLVAGLVKHKIIVEDLKVENISIGVTEENKEERALLHDAELVRKIDVKYKVVARMLHSRKIQYREWIEGWREVDPDGEIDRFLRKVFEARSEEEALEIVEAALAADEAHAMTTAPNPSDALGASAAMSDKKQKDVKVEVSLLDTRWIESLPDKDWLREEPVRQDIIIDLFERTQGIRFQVTQLDEGVVTLQINGLREGYESPEVKLKNNKPVLLTLPEEVLPEGQEHVQFHYLEYDSKSKQLKMVVTRSAYQATDEFVQNHKIHGFQTAQALVDQEIDDAVKTFEMLKEIREWMDANGMQDSPLVVWQNLRLGELYPYLTNSMLERLNVAKLNINPHDEGNDDKTYSHQIEGEEIPEGVYFVLSKMYYSSFEADHESIYENEIKDGVDILVKFIKKHNAVAVMIDHSDHEKLKVSKAQDSVSRYLLIDHTQMHFLTIDQRRPLPLQPHEANFVFFNPSSGKKSGLDDSPFHNPRVYGAVESLPLEQFVLIGGKPRHISALAREYYGERLEERLDSEIAKFSSRAMVSKEQTPSNEANAMTTMHREVAEDAAMSEKRDSKAGIEVKATGLLMTGIKYMSFEQYEFIRTHGLLPRNERLRRGSLEPGESTYFPDKVSLTLSADRGLDSTSLSFYMEYIQIGEVRTSAIFLIDPTYVQKNRKKFELVGRDFMGRRFHKEGLEFLGLSGHTPVHGEPSDDEVHVEEIPLEAILGIIVHPEMVSIILEWDREVGVENFPIFVVPERDSEPESIISIDPEGFIQNFIDDGGDGENRTISDDAMTTAPDAAMSQDIDPKILGVHSLETGDEIIIKQTAELSAEEYGEVQRWHKVLTQDFNGNDRKILAFNADKELVGAFRIVQWMERAKVVTGGGIIVRRDQGRKGIATRLFFEAMRELKELGFNAFQDNLYDKRDKKSMKLFRKWERVFGKELVTITVNPDGSVEFEFDLERFDPDLKWDLDTRVRAPVESGQEGEDEAHAMTTAPNPSDALGASAAMSVESLVAQLKKRHLFLGQNAQRLFENRELRDDTKVKFLRGLVGLTDEYAPKYVNEDLEAVIMHRPFDELRREITEISDENFEDSLDSIINIIEIRRKYNYNLGAFNWYFRNGDRKEETLALFSELFTRIANSLGQVGKDFTVSFYVTTDLKLLNAIVDFAERFIQIHSHNSSEVNAEKIWQALRILSNRYNVRTQTQEFIDALPQAEVLVDPLNQDERELSEVFSVMDIERPFFSYVDDFGITSSARFVTSAVLHRAPPLKLEVPEGFPLLGELVRVGHPVNITIGGLIQHVQEVYGLGEEIEFVEDPKGRSLEFKDENGNVLRVKFQKEGEDIRTLAYENRVLAYDANQPPIRGEVLPAAVQLDGQEGFVFKVDLLENQREALFRVSKESFNNSGQGYHIDRNMHAIVQFVPAASGYMNYLNKDNVPRWEDFIQSTTKAAYRLGAKARAGVMHTGLSESFHGNRQFLMLMALGKNGLGRQASFMESVKWIDVGAGGEVRDRADDRHITEILKDDIREYLGRDFGHTIHLEVVKKGDRLINFIVWDYLSQYAHTLIINLATWLHKNNWLDMRWDDDESIESLVEVLKQIYINLISGFWGRSLTEEDLKELGFDQIDWLMSARQIVYYLGVNYKLGPVPEKIYDEGTIATIKNKTILGPPTIKEFDDEFGFAGSPAERKNGLHSATGWFGGAHLPYEMVHAHLIVLGQAVALKAWRESDTRSAAMTTAPDPSDALGASAAMSASIPKAQTSTPVFEKVIIPNVGLSSMKPEEVQEEFRALVEGGVEINRVNYAANYREGVYLERYLPNYKIDLFNTTYYIVKASMDDNMVNIFSYVVQKDFETGELMIYPRLFYLDISLMWRSASHIVVDYKGKTFWYGKGTRKEVLTRQGTVTENQETTTNLPMEIQSALDEVWQKTLPLGSDEESFKWFSAVYRDRPHPNDDFDPQRIWAESNLQNLVNRDKWVAYLERLNDPSSLAFVRGFKPDLQGGIIDVGPELQHDDWIGVRRYRALAENREAQVQFVATPRGGYWNPYQPLTTDLTSYGVRSTTVNAEEYVHIPGLEFDSQIPKGYIGDLLLGSTTRAYAFRWINNLSIIHEFNERIASREAIQPNYTGSFDELTMTTDLSEVGIGALKDEMRNRDAKKRRSMSHARQDDIAIAPNNGGEVIIERVSKDGKIYLKGDSTGYSPMWLDVRGYELKSNYAMTTAPDPSDALGASAAMSKEDHKDIMEPVDKRIRRIYDDGFGHVTSDVFNHESLMYALAVRQRVNPNNLPLTAIYGGAGADISGALVMLGARENLFVSHYEHLTVEDLKEVRVKLGILKERGDHALDELGSAEHMIRYLEAKHYSGGAHSGDTEHKQYLIMGLVLELNALRIYDIEVDNERGHPRIRFQWDMFGLVPSQEHSISFIDADITKPDEYPSLLRDRVEEGVDVYLQKRGYRIAESYYEEGPKNFIRRIYDGMPEGAYFVTDDQYISNEVITSDGPAGKPNGDASLDFPLEDEQFIQISMPQDEAFKDIPTKKRYGRYLRLRQVIKPSGGAAAMTATPDSSDTLGASAAMGSNSDDWKKLAKEVKEKGLVEKAKGEGLAEGPKKKSNSVRDEEKAKGYPNKKELLAALKRNGGHQSNTGAEFGIVNTIVARLEKLYGIQEKAKRMREKERQRKKELLGKKKNKELPNYAMTTTPDAAMVKKMKAKYTVELVEEDFEGDVRKVTEILRRAFEDTDFYIPDDNATPEDLLEDVRVLYRKLPPQGQEMFRLQLHYFDANFDNKKKRGTWPNNVLLNHYLTPAKPGAKIDNSRTTQLRERMDLPLLEVESFDPDLAPWDERQNRTSIPTTFDMREVRRIHRVLRGVPYPTNDDIREVRKDLAKFIPGNDFEKFIQFYQRVKQVVSPESISNSVIIYIVQFLIEHKGNAPHPTEINAHFSRGAVFGHNAYKRFEGIAKELKLPLPWHAAPYVTSDEPIDQESYDRLERVLEGSLSQSGLIIINNKELVKNIPPIQTVQAKKVAKKKKVSDVQSDRQKQRRRKLEMWEARGGSEDTLRVRSHSINNLIRFFAPQLQKMSTAEVAEFLGYGYSATSQAFQNDTKLAELVDLVPGADKAMATSEKVPDAAMSGAATDSVVVKKSQSEKPEVKITNRVQRYLNVMGKIQSIVDGDIEIEGDILTEIQSRMNRLKEDHFDFKGDDYLALEHYFTHPKAARVNLDGRRYDLGTYMAGRVAVFGAEDTMVRANPRRPMVRIVIDLENVDNFGLFVSIEGEIKLLTGYDDKWQSLEIDSDKNQVPVSSLVNNMAVRRFFHRIQQNYYRNNINLQRELKGGAKKFYRKRGSGGGLELTPKFYRVPPSGRIKVYLPITGESTKRKPDDESESTWEFLESTLERIDQSASPPASEFTYLQDKNNPEEGVLILKGYTGITVISSSGEMEEFDYPESGDLTISNQAFIDDLLMQMMYKYRPQYWQIMPKKKANQLFLMGGKVKTTINFLTHEGIVVRKLSVDTRRYSSRVPRVIHYKRGSIVNRTFLVGPGLVAMDSFGDHDKPFADYTVLNGTNFLMHETMKSLKTIGEEDIIRNLYGVARLETKFRHENRSVDVLRIGKILVVNDGGVWHRRRLRHILDVKSDEYRDLLHEINGADFLAVEGRLKKELVVEKSDSSYVPSSMQTVVTAIVEEILEVDRVVAAKEESDGLKEDVKQEENVKKEESSKSAEDTVSKKTVKKKTTGKKTAKKKVAKSQGKGRLTGQGPADQIDTKPAKKQRILKKGDHDREFTVDDIQEAYVKLGDDEVEVLMTYIEKAGELGVLDRLVKFAAKRDLGLIKQLSEEIYGEGALRTVEGFYWLTDLVIGLVGGDRYPAEDLDFVALGFWLNRVIKGELNGGWEVVSEEADESKAMTTNEKAFDSSDSLGASAAMADIEGVEVNKLLKKIRDPNDELKALVEQFGKKAQGDKLSDEDRERVQRVIQRLKRNEMSFLILQINLALLAMLDSLKKYEDRVSLNRKGQALNEERRRLGRLEEYKKVTDEILRLKKNIIVLLAKTLAEMDGAMPTSRETPDAAMGKGDESRLRTLHYFTSDQVEGWNKQNPHLFRTFYPNRQVEPVFNALHKWSQKVNVYQKLFTIDFLKEAIPQFYGHFRFEPEGRVHPGVQALGSGFFFGYDKDYVYGLTAAHVIEFAETFQDDGREMVVLSIAEHKMAAEVLHLDYEQSDFGDKRVLLIDQAVFRVKRSVLEGSGQRIALFPIADINPDENEFVAFLAFGRVEQGKQIIEAVTQGFATEFPGTTNVLYFDGSSFEGFSGSPAINLISGDVQGMFFKRHKENRYSAIMAAPVLKFWLQQKGVLGGESKIYFPDEVEFLNFAMTASEKAPDSSDSLGASAAMSTMVGEVMKKVPMEKKVDAFYEYMGIVLDDSYEVFGYKPSEFWGVISHAFIMFYEDYGEPFPGENYVDGLVEQALREVVDEEGMNELELRSKDGFVFFREEGKLWLLGPKMTKPAIERRQQIRLLLEAFEAAYERLDVERNIVELTEDQTIEEMGKLIPRGLQLLKDPHLSDEELEQLDEDYLKERAAYDQELESFSEQGFWIKTHKGTFDERINRQIAKRALPLFKNHYLTFNNLIPNSRYRVHLVREEGLGLRIYLIHMGVEGHVVKYDPRDFHDFRDLEEEASTTALLITEEKTLKEAEAFSDEWFVDLLDEYVHFKHESIRDDGEVQGDREERLAKAEARLKRHPTLIPAGRAIKKTSTNPEGRKGRGSKNPKINATLSNGQKVAMQHVEANTEYNIIPHLSLNNQLILFAKNGGASYIPYGVVVTADEEGQVSVMLSKIKEEVLSLNDEKVKEKIAERVRFQSEGKELFETIASRGTAYKEGFDDDEDAQLRRDSEEFREKRFKFPVTSDYENGKGRIYMYLNDGQRSRLRFDNLDAEAYYMESFIEEKWGLTFYLSSDDGRTKAYSARRVIDPNTLKHTFRTTVIAEGESLGDVQSAVRSKDPEEDYEGFLYLSLKAINQAARKSPSPKKGKDNNEMELADFLSRIGFTKEEVKYFIPYYRKARGNGLKRKGDFQVNSKVQEMEDWTDELGLTDDIIKHLPRADYFISEAGNKKYSKLSRYGRKTIALTIWFSARLDDFFDMLITYVRSYNVKIKDLAMVVKVPDSSDSLGASAAMTATGVPGFFFVPSAQNLYEDLIKRNSHDKYRKLLRFLAQDRPLVVEIGNGDGHWLFEQALRGNPDINFVGLDIRQKRKRIYETENVLFLDFGIVEFLKLLPIGSIDYLVAAYPEADMMRDLVSLQLSSNKLGRKMKPEYAIRIMFANKNDEKRMVDERFKQAFSLSPVVLGEEKKGSILNLNEGFPSRGDGIINFDDAYDLTLKDPAMMKESPGGIDLNPNAIEFKREGQGVQFDFPEFTPDEIEMFRLNGFTPVIINITPVTNIPMLLGIIDAEDLQKFSRMKEEHEKDPFGRLSRSEAVRVSEYLSLN